MIYAIHEALRMVLEEGLEPRFARHHANHRALIAGLAVLDIHPTVAESERLWMLNSVAVPDGVDDREIRGRLLGRHGIEIGGGLGPLAGKIWRIGLMGESSRIENVRRLLACLAIELRSARANQAIDAADRCA
jgi:alanine-glyoxylate transaminase/serine-glyoxylate transaminase/serine-pyruvate transaminase